MKKLLLILLALTLCALCFTACKKDEPEVDNPTADNQNQTGNGEHVHTPAVAVVENKIPATCTIDGSYDLVIYCTGCGVKMIWTTNTEPALGHNYVNTVCTVCGDVNYSEGLAFTSNGDGTCYVSGIGTCTDTEVVIPITSPDGDNVTGVGYGAFYNCTSLTSIAIPDSVTIIGELAFALCTSLTSVEIGDSVTSIGSGAFYNCTGLTVITMSEGVTNIGDSAFYSCTSLKNIVIPEGVVSIGANAFYECTSVGRITIPDSVTTIGDSAFSCTIPTSIEVAENNQNYKSIDGNLYTKDGQTLIKYAAGKTETSFVIPNGVTSIGVLAFYRCESLTSIMIPNSVKHIGNSAFFDCDGLTNIVIPDSVTSIGSMAFYMCSNLTSITIPDGVTVIDNMSFFECTNLVSITIPDSVTTIGYGVFSNCDSLTNVYYKGSEADWAKISIGDYNQNLTGANITYNYQN